MTTDNDADLIREEWQRDMAERRMQAFLARRPAAFAKPGRLDPRIHEWLERAVRGEALTLHLLGGTGVGKTWSLWKIEQTLIANMWPGRFEQITAYDLSRLIAPPLDEARIDELARVDVLALDDSGAVRTTEWAGDHLYGLIDRRWSHQLPTIIATNVTDLQDLFGKRAASRLSDGLSRIVLKGEDLRLP